MNYLDRMILEFFNRFSQRSWAFDNVISLLSSAEFLKGGLVVVVLWGLWFARDKEEAVVETRKTVLATFAGSFLALGLAMALAVTLPFRIRPLHQLNINFQLPFGMHRGVLEGWSSFPSDHAALFAGLVTGIFLISHRLGFFSIIYVFLAVLIPRIYLGLHYPTDILGGIFLGFVCVLLMNRKMIKKALTDPLYEWSEKYPHLFYGAFFMVSFETAELFSDIREFAKGLLPVVNLVVHRFF